jgi:cyclase
MMTRRALFFTLAALAATSAWAQSSNTKVEILPVQGNVYLIARAGANITVQVGADGVLLVDSGSAGMSDEVLAAIQKICGKPRGSPLEGKIRYIVNTSADSDHTGGNERLSKAGIGFNTNDPANSVSDTSSNPAGIIAHVDVVKRMMAPPNGARPAATAALPQDTYSGDGPSIKDLYFDNDGIQIIHIPAAHTDGDSIVYFHKNDVVSAGDIFVTTGYPVIDLARGGGLQGIIEGLNRLLDIAIPGKDEEDGTIIVPGHGRLCDEADLVEYRDMITIIRDRILDMVKRGATLEQVKAARLTRDFDPEYGAGGAGSWPTDRFVEAAYKSLAREK